MAEYKYVVTSNTGDLAEKEFTNIKDALEYAKQAMDTFIYEYQVDAEGDDAEEFECVWSWDDIWDNDEEVISRVERGHSDMSDVEDDIDEAFRISIEKNGDNTRVETQGDEAQELMDFAKAILGDNFDIFDQDFADAVEITDTEVEPAEFDYEIDATKEIDGKDVDPFEDDLFSEDEEDGSEEPVEPSEESAKDSDDEESEDDDYVPDESKELVAEIEKTSADETPKDMIGGKLVDAKDPTESEVEVEDDEDLEECTTAEFVNEDARELKGDLKLAAEADADYREAELRRGEEQAEAEQEAREEATEETPAEITARIDAALDAWNFDDSEWPEPEDLDSLPREGEEIPLPSDEDAPIEDDDMSDEEFAEAFGKALADKKKLKEEDEVVDDEEDIEDEELTEIFNNDISGNFSNNSVNVDLGDLGSGIAAVAPLLADDAGEKLDDEDNQEELVEHVNEENDPIESDQELQRTDNAVNACKVNKVITHADDEVKELTESFTIKEMTQFMDLCKKLGLKTSADVKKYVQEHNNAEGQQLLQIMADEVKNKENTK